MGRLYSAAAICALIISAVPVVAAAQANINTSRSNSKGVAAPGGGAVSTDGSAQGQPAEKANHNTARSNKNTVAAPADLPGPAGAESAAQPIGKKGHDHYQNRSDAAAAAAAAGPDGSAVLPEGAGAASTTVPKQTQGATFGEKVNAGLQASGSAVTQSPAAEGGAGECKAPAEAKQAAAPALSKSGQPKASGMVTAANGKPDECNGPAR